MGEGATLASALAGSTASIVSADVALDSAEPVVGSFTADGLTYAVGPDGLMLVSADASVLADGAIAIPASVTYDGTAYDVTSIGSYAFYLSGATSVELPASIASVDSRALRSCDVERVEVDSGNPNLASYDGALYAADLSRLLLIPGGRGGAVRIPDNAEEVPAAAFSHCAQVDAVSVDGGSPAFSSWEGLLYDASGQTLLRVPTGATEITIRDGCTTIAAGAMEGCAKLERITAPASVTSISPDVFESVPTVSLPITLALQDESGGSAQAEGEAEVAPRRVVAESQGLSAPLALPDLGSTSASPSAEAEAQASSQNEENPSVASALADQSNASADFGPQLTVMVALSSSDDDLPEVDPASIEVALPMEIGEGVWRLRGFAVSKVEAVPEIDGLSQSEAKTAYSEYQVTVYANGRNCTMTQAVWDRINGGPKWTISTWTMRGNESFTGWDATSYQSQDTLASIDFANRSNSGETTVEYVQVSGNSPGWHIDGFSQYAGGPKYLSHGAAYGNARLYARWVANAYTVKLDAQGGSVSTSSISATYDQDATLPAPDARPGYRFLGWSTATDGSGTTYQPGVVRNLTATDGATITLYAQWEPYEIDFDVDSEPGDVDYPGEPKDPISAPDAVGPDGTIPIEDPKRPGYIFQGWVIPNDGGTEAVDQDLVYQGADKKWYVDASKLPLPEYAGDDGRVELTARWTSVISVDVPSSVTFYADLVTQGQESREGAAEGAFGQNQVSNQSQVDLRVVGLESSAVKTTDTTLGADSVLKKADAATPSTSTQKLLSLYPSTKQWKPEDLQNPDAVGGSKAATAVDFDLDDILLEKSFKADDFTIAAGDTLNMGYRLNLAESGQQLDYDKLSTLEDGRSAAIANVSYCFAADALPSDWDEPLWVENPDRTSNPAKYLLLKDIKAAADDLSANGTNSEYYATYKSLLEDGAAFQLRVDGAYSPVQLIGICQDAKAAGGGVAGLTFSFKDPWRLGAMNATDTGAGGWEASQVRALLRGDGTYAGAGFADKVDERLRASVVTVSKRQQLQPADGNGLQTTSDTFFIPSCYEVFGTNSNGVWNGDESPSSCFQYQWFAQWGANYDAVPERVKGYGGAPVYWWTRSACSANNRGFGGVSATGSYAFMGASPEIGIVPCFCL